MPISVGTTHQTFMVMSMALFICLLLNKIVTTKDITPKTLFSIYKSTDLQTKQLKSTSSWLKCNNRYTLKIMTFQTIPAQPINLQFDDELQGEHTRISCWTKRVTSFPAIGTDLMLLPMT